MSRFTRDMEAAALMVPINILRRLLRYEPETGKLFWLPRAAEMFPGTGRGGAQAESVRWNACHAGREALTPINSSGYRTGTILRRQYYAHRVIWALQTGNWPAALVDHRNGDKADNRWENLRAASRAENAHNQKIGRTNSTGVKGVTRDKDRWRGMIMLDGKSHNVGRFSSLAEAESEVRAIRHRLHGEFGRDK